MKILFLIPKIQVGSYFGYPLGLCYLSAMLKKNGYQDIMGVDLNLDRQSKIESLLSEIDILGIQVHHKTLSQVLCLARRAKVLNPKIRIVIGGPHATLCPEEIICDEAVDFVVMREGEYTILELIRAIEKNHGFQEIKGIWYREKGEVKKNPAREFAKNLDGFPFPDHDLFDLKRYEENLHGIPIIATRSCPYHCTNCMPALKEIMGPYRMRSIENVIGEIKLLQKRYQRNDFYFFDNDVTVNRKWLTKFCERLIEEDLHIAYYVSVRINTLDRESIILMKRSGCRGFMVGIESGSQYVINKVLLKEIPLGKVRELLKMAEGIGLEQHVYFMIGIPGESKEQMLKTVDFAKRLNVDSMQFNIGDPLPHTGYWYLAKEKGWLLGKTWDDYENPQGRSMIRTDHWGPEFVEKVKQKIMHDFEKAGWLVWRKRFYINISMANFTKFIEKKNIWQFARFLSGEGKRFLKDFRILHLKNIIRALRVKLRRNLYAVD